MDHQYVALFNSVQAGLILKASTGLCWRSWVGEKTTASFNGWAERSMEGFYVPVSNDAPPDCTTLEERLQEVWPKNLSEFNAFEVNEVLAEISSSDVISVDLTAVHEALPGWLPIHVEPQGDFSLLSEPNGNGSHRPMKGVLVWPPTFW